ncbi:MAG TPA: tetratricopeptide repeat protein [Ramlibacter sp.]|nr:tetratricopeptide repeat protein [Ramlibacter sp.]
MLRRVLSIAVCVLGLAACAGVPTGMSVPQLPWRDAAFGYDGAPVAVSREELFRLDPQLLERLQAQVPATLSTGQRLKALLATVFGPDGHGFSYAAGHSTTAAQTWRLQRGDCLSLTVLTYAVARALNMAAQMQEVPTPVLYDRRGGLDFVNQHVNVLFQRAHRTPMEGTGFRDVIVDFEPDLASARAGLVLSEDAILARYYNNIAAEHLADGSSALAYAHFKAAILADPAYAASYGNLAVLYRGAGLAAEAEQLLRHALARANPPDVPLHGLYQLLLAQGRDAEAEHYAQLLQARQSRDPYHWISLGFRHLQEGDWRGAIAALERAQGMVSGFPEVHRYLALAYWRAGEPALANEQLARLASLAGTDAAVSSLSRKFNPDRH